MPVLMAAMLAIVMPMAVLGNPGLMAMLRVGIGLMGL